MRIGVVSVNNINSSRKNDQNRVNKQSNNTLVSFGASFDSVEIAKKTTPTLSELIQEHDSTVNEIKSQLAIHKKSTNAITQKAIEIQRNTNQAHRGITFEEFQDAINLKQLEPIVKVYKKLESNPQVRTLKEQSINNAYQNLLSGAGVLFKSKDKQLARDIIQLYPFFTQARWNQQERCSNFVHFFDMFLKSFTFDYQTINSPQGDTKDNTWCDKLQDKLLSTIEETGDKYDKTQRPTLVYVEDLETLLDKKTNSIENIAEMKAVLTDASCDYKTLFFGHINNPISPTIDKGTIQSNRLDFQQAIDLDSLNISKEQLDYIKQAKSNLGSQTQEIAQLYKQLNPQDKQRFWLIDDLFDKLLDINEQIKLLFCPQDYQEDFSAMANQEFTNLAYDTSCESYTKNQSFINKIINNNPAQPIQPAQTPTESIESAQSAAQSADSGKILPAKPATADQSSTVQGIPEQPIIQEPITQPKPQTLEDKTSLSQSLDNVQAQVKEQISSNIAENANETREEIKQNIKRISKNKIFASLVILLGIAGIAAFFIKKIISKQGDNSKIKQFIISIKNKFNKLK